MTIPNDLHAASADVAGTTESTDPSGGVVETIRRALAAAGIDSLSGPMRDVGRTIDEALAAAGLRMPGVTPASPGSTIDVEARELRPPSAAAQAPAALDDGSLTGEFSTHRFSSGAGSRSYHVYVPLGHAAGAGEPVPLVVMLHGCTQSADDFATGTQMNALADEQGFLVVYPEQSANANGSRCWNWFRPEDQARDGGEPALIAGITREVAAQYAVDPRRIYVAGLSAGASMAVILGNTYPDLYAAVGAHSGLPYAAAHDMASAFAAMQNGPAAGMQEWPHPPASAAATGNTLAAVPTIVFHGDRDATVAVRNGAQIAEQALGGTRLSRQVEEGGSPERRYTRTIYSDGADRQRVEHWVISGAGHAWSGGSPQGSFTDAAGPDASAEMVRFFFAQQSAKAT